MSAAFEDIRVDRVKAALTDPAAVAAFESLMEQLDGAMEVAVGAERAAFLMRGEVAAAERERARADRAEAALEVFANPGSWEVTPELWKLGAARFLADDGIHGTPWGFARAALSVGSGERETTFDGSNTAPCVPRERGAVITAAREECAKLIDTKVAPLLASGSLPPMWTWWLPLVDAISERLKDAAGSGGRETTFQWLIERGQPEGEERTVWASHTWRDEPWTTDARTASMFPTREAAEAYIAERGFEARAVEHGFMSGGREPT